MLPMAGDRPWLSRILRTPCAAWIDIAHGGVFAFLEENVQVGSLRESCCRLVRRPGHLAARPEMLALYRFCKAELDVGGSSTSQTVTSLSPGAGA